MEKIKVVNLKSQECVRKIKRELYGAGMINVDVQVNNQLVSFEGGRETGIEILTSMGYPEKGSRNNLSFIKKIKLHVSHKIKK